MDLLIKFLVICFCIKGYICTGKKDTDTNTQPPPRQVLHPERVNRFANVHLTSLTGELLRESVGKMRYAKQVTEKFSDNAMFRVGIVASNVQHLFDRMVHIYRDVSNLTKFRMQNYNEMNAAGYAIDAISITQSLLHRIRLEKKLYMELIRGDQEKQRLKYQHLKKKHKHMVKSLPLPPKPKGGMFQARRSDSWFDEEFDLNFELPSKASPKTVQNNQNNDKIPKVSIKKDTVSTPRQNAPTRKPSGQISPYSELARMLSASGVAPKSESSLLRLVEDNTKKNHRRHGKEKHDNQVPKLTRNNNKDSFQRALNRRSLNSDGKTGQQVLKNQLLNLEATTKKVLWRPAQQTFEIGSNAQPTNRRSATNVQLSNDNEALLFKKVQDNVAKATPKRVLWRPGQMYKQKRWYENKGQQSMADERQKITKTEPNYQQTMTNHQAEGTNIEKNGRRSLDQKPTVKKALWRPGHLSNQGLYDNIGEEIKSNDQPLNNNDAEIALQPVGNIQENKAKKVLWRPGQGTNQRRNYDNNGEILAQSPNDERSIDDAIALQPINTRSLDSKPAVKKAIWRPGQNSRRWHDNEAVTTKESDVKEEISVAQLPSDSIQEAMRVSNIGKEDEGSKKPAKKILWRPGLGPVSNQRRWYDVDGTGQRPYMD